GGRGGGGGELRLAARALEEDDQFARDVAGRVRAVVVLDEGQAQVDARADAGGGDEAPVPDVDRVRFDTHPRVAPGEAPGVPPVRGGPAAVEQPEVRQHEGAGAHRGDPPGGRGQGTG